MDLGGRGVKAPCLKGWNPWDFATMATHTHGIFRAGRWLDVTLRNALAIPFRIVRGLLQTAQTGKDQCEGEGPLSDAESRLGNDRFQAGEAHDLASW